MKSFLIIICMAWSIIGFSQDTTQWEAKADTVVKYAKSQLGVTYKWGTCQPGKCFDCSGFTNYAYKHVGVSCLRSSSGLNNCGDDIALEEARKGDMILFRGTNPNDHSIGHVGIVLKNEPNDLQFIHCSSSQRHYGVVITDYYKSGYPKRFIKVKRVFE